MSINRRAASAVLAALVSQLFTRRADADTVIYTYDAFGRLVRAQYSDGAIINYGYDNAGNRYAIANGTLPPPPPPPLPFNSTLQLTGSAPVNLRALADAAGYTGLQGATINFEVGAGVTITGAAGVVNGSIPGGAGIDTGTWPTGAYAITLMLTVKNGGIVRGGGGYGGSGNGGPGSNGGDAITCRAPLSINVNAGGAVQGAGGGGGGGGVGSTGGFEPVEIGGGGGGGGAPNGPGGPGANAPGGNGASGSPGTTIGGGAGGAGGFDGSEGAGNGQAGGGYAASGVAGESTPHQPGGAGGSPGYAIRKNSNVVLVTNNGTITGTIG